MNQPYPISLSRRGFLGAVLATSSCCLLPFPLLSGCARVTAGNYYLSHRDSLLKDFRQTNQGAEQYLTSAFGEKMARDVTQGAARNFDDLLPELPDVGGERNWDTQYLIIAAWYIAYYEPMKAHEKTTEDVGRMIYVLNRTGLEQIPKASAQAEGANKFTEASLDAMQKWADWTQKREYPANWVATFLRGDGKDFDFGYDYTECALCKYFQANGVRELAPYVCLNDFVSSRAQGTGLSRSKTLAQGDDRCNFRYKKGRPVTQSWSTEIPLIRVRGKQGII